MANIASNFPGKFYDQNCSLGCDIPETLAHIIVCSENNEKYENVLIEDLFNENIHNMNRTASRLQQIIDNRNIQKTYKIIQKQNIKLK